jgi:hypothetical protein
MNQAFRFSRRRPDFVTEALVTALSDLTAFEFKPLFTVVHADLRSRNLTSGGEEMLRLRAYEKLQGLVARGVVVKKGKAYKGKKARLAALRTEMDEWANGNGPRGVQPVVKAKTAGK